MDRQISLRLPTLLAKKLDGAALRLQCKRSEVVRLALEQFLGVTVEVRPIERVRDLLGKVESGIPDLGALHHNYLKTRLQRAERSLI